MLKILTFICVFVLIGISSQSHGDDTELYVFETATDAGARPKVLIIFDNSGSMDTKENVPDPDFIPPVDYDSDYNPSKDYSGTGISDVIYFSTSSSTNLESLLNSNQSFYSKYNGCHQSWTPLADIGFFKGRVGEFYKKSNSWSWNKLRTDESLATKRYVDCLEDVTAEDPINSSDYGTSGFPKNGTKNVPYTHVSSPSENGWVAAINTAKSTNVKTLDSVTLYSKNYLLWYKKLKDGIIPIVSKKRIDIAKKAISDVIKTTPSVDFGLAVFNENTNNRKEGGRIVSGIQDMSPGTTPGIAARNNILTKIGQLNPETNTPLCETLFEAYRYLSGGAVQFGHEDTASPKWDTNVESSNKYISPLKICTDMAYVIYVTDGAPTSDSDADGLVKNLTSGASKFGNYDVFSYKPDPKKSDKISSYLPALASYMYQNDLVNKTDDNDDNPLQNARTFTIGFSSGADDAAPLLIETAKRGGGKYFAAQDSLQLTNALSDALSSILEIDSSFTSPSIASNNFDRTQTFDSAYYAMFLPGKGPRWTGNLKKLKVNSSGTLVDAKGSIAIGDNGNIKKEACTFWTNCSGGTDGNQVEIGGVTQMLEGLTKRKVLSNTASGNGLEELTIANAANGSKANLAAYMSIDEAELDATFKWLLGVDVDDEDGDNSTTDKRKDIMGDPLHSKPLAINFGTSAAPDIRVLLGTNHGLLHMFKDSGVSVDETWAFMPYELLPNVPILRENLPGGHYVYGMDASPVAYVKSSIDGTKPSDVWVFAGMRRGGSSYYALNVTSPDTPSLMWAINPETLGFSELGQTWAEPIITLIPGHSTPVLIFGGGYDVSYDSTPSGTPSGRNVYIVDAKLGTLLHTFGTSAGTNATVLPGIIDSIPNAVAVLDSNNDGVTDRIYATDTGGNVWRMDLPSEDDKTWTAYKFASLGGDLAADRRFFAEPVVAQTTFNNISEVSVVDPSGAKTVTKNYQNVPYDAIAIGSGNRPTPLSKSTEDMYYVLQDRNVITKSYGGSGNPVAPAAITLGNLYNVTAAPPKTETENIAFGKKLGWYYDYPTAGEKSLTASLIVDGKVYFTSFVPPSQSVSDTVCTVSGLGRLYVFDLHKGTRTLTSVYYELGERVPDTPQIVIPTPESGKDPYIYIIGVGKGEKRDDGEYSGTINVGSGLGVNKIYYHIDDN
ncbi:type IV pilus assembly protein PilY1 [Shewanella morhuae]|uniref:pilus assembly protein n=1 Tax=Shewanella morhuae TaxID=365591 RepID=UPI000956A4A4|nr:PilC/PilY family type IV pilus protein [Shewanella morhuae]SIQ60748.1 type IV pilus assembly protein PilY1 [Shewanella morhuae]